VEITNELRWDGLRSTLACRQGPVRGPNGKCRMSDIATFSRGRSDASITSAEVQH
jgi:hypothetical protein